MYTMRNGTRLSLTVHKTLGLTAPRYRHTPIPKGKNRIFGNTDCVEKRVRAYAREIKNDLKQTFFFFLNTCYIIYIYLYILPRAVQGDFEVRE